MEETNYSLTGVLSEKLDNKTKISLGMLIAGIGLFSWALYKEGNGISYEKILGFLFIMTGSGLFFNKNWRVSLGSILFVLGIVLLYLGYVYKGKGDKDLLYTMTLSGFCIMALAWITGQGSGELNFKLQLQVYPLRNLTSAMGTPKCMFGCVQRLQIDLQLTGLGP